MRCKFFAAIIFTVIFLVNAPIFAQADSEDLPDEEIPELDPAYKDAPIYDEEETPPETSTPEINDEGLEFLVYNENGVMAFAVIADHEKYYLRPILAKGQIQGRATVAQMSKNLDEIAMINASYFMPSGSLIGVTKIDGDIVGVDEYYRSAIGITYDEKIIFGRVRYEGSVNFYGSRIYLSGVNWERGENALILYNRYFGKTTGTNNYGVEVVVQDGTITEIYRDKGNNVIPFDGYVISAHGTAAAFFNDAQVGDALTIDQQIFSDNSEFRNVPTIIGAGPRLVKDGKVYVTAADEKFPADIRVGRAPRSAVGVNAYGDYIFAVVDGRQAHSRGCTLEEWANILLKKFGAVNAINLDGGGSTELIVKDSLVNIPSDGRERMIGSSLAIFRR